MENDIRQSRAVLVGIAKDSSEVKACENSMEELERLLITAGGTALAKVIQIKSSFDPATCIGKGKVEEIGDLCKANEINLAVFDFDLSPSQIRNLEEAWNDVQVIDRSMLILDIFALHAVSGEGKLQVELAQLKYTAPRLMGQGLALSRLGGTIGTRGPGETKLETDRRHIHRRIVSLEEQIREMEKNRVTMRQSRDRSGIPKVALVGYTNAGKSTVLNLLTKAGVLSEDKLFATLDPTTRKYQLPDGEQILLTDTVGFIRNLPHHLIKAFRSTLDEAVYADILLIVVDASDPLYEEQLEITRETLRHLGAENKPTLVVYNKVDRLSEDEILLIRDLDHSVCISAKTEEGVDRFLDLLGEIIKQNKKTTRLCFPYSEQGAAASVYGCGKVESFEYKDDCIEVVCVLDEKDRGRYRRFLAEETEEGDTEDGCL